MQLRECYGLWKINKQFIHWLCRIIFFSTPLFCKNGRNIPSKDDSLNSDILLVFRNWRLWGRKTCYPGVYQSGLFFFILKFISWIRILRNFDKICSSFPINLSFLNRSILSGPNFPIWMASQSDRFFTSL